MMTDFGSSQKETRGEYSRASFIWAATKKWSLATNDVSIGKWRRSKIGGLEMFNYPGVAAYGGGGHSNMLAVWRRKRPGRIASLGLPEWSCLPFEVDM